MRMEEAGLSKKTISEAMLDRMSKMTSEDRKKNALAANKARRGTKVSLSEARRRAEALQKIGQISDLEQKFLDKLAHRFECVPQYAFSKYNIDIAIPTQKIAIEVQGGTWHSSRRKVVQDANKLACLSRGGWLVIYIFEWDLRNIDSLISRLNKLCGNPFAVDEVQVIWSTPENDVSELKHHQMPLPLSLA